MENPKANELMMRERPRSLNFEDDVLTELRKMGRGRNAQPSKEQLVDYVDEICNLISYRITYADVFAALDILRNAERSEGESTWPEWGKVRNAIERQSLNRRGAEARAQRAEAERMDRESIEVANAEGPDAETAARIAKLNAKLSLKPTQAPQDSTPAPSGSLRDMTADAAEAVFVFITKLNAMSDECRLASIACVAACITTDGCDAMGRVIRVHWPKSRTDAEREFDGLDTNENEYEYKPH